MTAKSRSSTTSCSSTCSDSPIKMRKRISPGRLRDNVEIIEIDEMKRRVVKRRSSTIRKTQRLLITMVAVALLGVSTIGWVTSGSLGGFFWYNRVGLEITRRRLGQKAAAAAAAAQKGSPTINVPNPIREFTLSDSVRDDLYKEVLSLKVDTGNLEDLETFLDSSKEIVENHLSVELMEALQSLHNIDSPTSAVLIKNLPVDPHVPATPTDGSLSLGKTTYVAEALLVAMGELTSAHVIGYSAETQYSNPWIHEGFPRNSKGSALTKASDLSFHQDMSYHSEPPDILALVCVREGHDKQVETELIDNREIYASLPESVVAMLQEPRFKIKTSAWVDASWKEDKPRPIVEGPSLALPVDWENMVGLDPEAEFAVELLKRTILEMPKHYVHFKEGDLLLFNNRRAVHARTPYKDLRFDGGDRVMYRSYFRHEFASSEERRTRMI